jgi:hypothetical protein
MSERALSSKLEMARETLRRIEKDPESTNLRSIRKVAKALGCEVIFAVFPTQEVRSEFSIAVTSWHIVQDGFDSWKIHLMNFVDEFRRTRDMRLLILPPIQSLDERLLALLASVCCELCGEIDAVAPSWARAEYFLPQPWFIHEMESLKAMSIQSTPIYFKRNNIYVLDNFLQRA